MRYIEKDFNNVTARTRLESLVYKADVEISVLAKKGTYQSGRYGHSDIRTELNEIYFDKCAYCESFIKPVSTPHVEHFRPKAKITGVNENGYYWLGYEWSNLLLACPSCNGAKSTKFPLLRNNHLNDHPSNAHAAIDYSKFPEDQGFCISERPLLINPEYWKPEKLMYFDYFAKLIPIKNNRFAITTINEIDLNRDSLVANRQRKIDKIINRIEQQIASRYGDIPLTEAQYQHQLNLIFQDIVSRVSRDSEYTLLGRCMIERFDELILEDIEEEFHSEIQEYFILFLESF